MNFKDLGLIAPILRALDAQGYAEPTPIQAGAIPPALLGRDVLGCAQTGTGKTCAFAAPILQRLEAHSGGRRPIRALILTPTRELAIQIGESFDAYGKYLTLRHAVIFGGVGQNPQVEALKAGVDILVATPGRLMDLHQQGFVDLEKLEIFVLDEADRMLDMGFIHDVKKILQWLPRKKQTLFFSATMPPEITDLVNSLLHDPVRMAVDPISSPVEVIDQKLYYVDRGNKTRLLAALIRELDDLRRQKNAADFTARAQEAKSRLRSRLNAAENAVDPVSNRLREEPYAPPRPLRQGDTVLLTDLDKEATVLAPPDSSGNVEVQAGIIRTRVPLAALRLIEGRKVSGPTPPKGRAATSSGSGRATRSVQTELDLRGQTADEALLEVDRFIDGAVMAGLGQITIIHGKGTGALRAAVHAHLRTHPSVKSYRLGTFGEGETGVTIVEI